MVNDQSVFALFEFFSFDIFLVFLFVKVKKNGNGKIIVKT